MTTTAAQLEDFAILLRGKSAWTPDIQQRLMDLIREPAMTWRGQIIPPNDRTKAIDNLFRCRPTAWSMGVEADPGPQCRARMRLWYQAPPDTFMTLHQEVDSGEVSFMTNALALTAATARVWAFIILQGRKSDFPDPS